MKYGIVHRGAAHADDIFSICLFLGKFGSKTPVYRRDPTEEELNDPKVCVMDVGGRHEPHLNNYDHHQLPRDHEPECAASLLVKGLKLKGFEHLRGFEALRILDSKGPTALGEFLGTDTDKALDSVSVVESGLRIVLKDLVEIPLEFRKVFSAIGNGIIMSAEKTAPAVERVLKCDLICFGKIHAILNESSDVAGVWEARPKIEQNLRKDRGSDEFDVAICISYNDRGPGWTLYRFNDHPRVDFSKIENDSRVEFAHKSGFVAKTYKRLELGELASLIKMAIE